MSTLVGLGATASFGVSCIAAGLPGLGWKTFFEEPAMLLGFVLVGRALEERAKLQASADMAALQVCCFHRVRAITWLRFAGQGLPVFHVSERHAFCSILALKLCCWYGVMKIQMSPLDLIDATCACHEP